MNPSTNNSEQPDIACDDAAGTPKKLRKQLNNKAFKQNYFEMSFDGQKPKVLKFPENEEEEKKKRRNKRSRRPAASRAAPTTNNNRKKTKTTPQDNSDDLVDKIQLSVFGNNKHVEVGGNSLFVTTSSSSAAVSSSSSTSLYDRSSLITPTSNILSSLFSGQSTSGASKKKPSRIVGTRGRSASIDPTHDMQREMTVAEFHRYRRNSLSTLNVRPQSDNEESIESPLYTEELQAGRTMEEWERLLEETKDCDGLPSFILPLSEQPQQQNSHNYQSTSAVQANHLGGGCSPLSPMHPNELMELFRQQDVVDQRSMPPALTSLIEEQFFFDYPETNNFVIDSHDSAVATVRPQTMVNQPAFDPTGLTQEQLFQCLCMVLQNSAPNNVNNTYQNYY